MYKSLFIILKKLNSLNDTIKVSHYFVYIIHLKQLDNIIKTKIINILKFYKSMLFVLIIGTVTTSNVYVNPI